MSCYVDEGLIYKGVNCFGYLNNINILRELHEQVIIVNWFSYTVTIVTKWPIYVSVYLLIQPIQCCKINWLSITQ